MPAPLPQQQQQQQQPVIGTPLLYGSKIRLFVCPDQQHSSTPGYVAGFFMDTALAPSLIVQQSTSTTATALAKPYNDLVQSIYFVLVDPSDPKLQIKKQVRFGDQFMLIPYNATTGEEITQPFEAISNVKFRDNLFTFLLSTLPVQQPSATTSSTIAPGNLNNILAQQQVDKIVRYGISNAILNIIVSSKKNPNATLTPIEFIKDRITSPTGGYLALKNDKFCDNINKLRKVGMAKDGTSTNIGEKDDVVMKPIVMTIRSAEEPLVTLSLYDQQQQTTSSNNNNTVVKTNNNSNDKNNTHNAKPGTLIKSIQVHALEQHYKLFEGDDEQYQKAVLVCELRDVGKVTIPVASLGNLPPLNFCYNKIAPPTTRDEYLDVYGENDNNNNNAIDNKTTNGNSNNNSSNSLIFNQPESIIKTLDIHGSQMTVQLPIRFTRIEAVPQKEAFNKGDINNKTFEKIQPPQPSLLICFITIFLLAYRFFQGMKDNVFNIVDYTNIYEYLNIIRFIGPAIIITYLALSYPTLYRNYGHSLNYRNTTPRSKYVIEILAPCCDPLSSNNNTNNNNTTKTLDLAYKIPSPFILATKGRAAIGYSDAYLSVDTNSEGLLLFTNNNNNTAAAPSTPTNNNNIVDTSVNSENEAKYFTDMKELMCNNNIYTKQLKILNARKTINLDSLRLMQELDAIRSSGTITDCNVSTKDLHHTISLNNIMYLDKQLNNINHHHPSSPNTDNNNNNGNTTTTATSNNKSNASTTDLKAIVKNLKQHNNNTTNNIAQYVSEITKNYDSNITYNIACSHQLTPLPSSTNEKDIVQYFTSNTKEVKLYYPFLFKAIRETHGVTTDDFISAWTFDITNLPSAGTGAGRSGAQFMRSSCGKYIFKTLNNMDMDTLHALVHDYTLYIANNPSCLMRIFGVYRTKDLLTGQKKYFLIANNVFYLPPKLDAIYKLNARYDLKGRTPKRIVEARRDTPDAGVFKDLQLSRVFVLHQSTREQIITNLDSDVRWLQAHDCIDYSLLVGVAENLDYTLALDDTNGEFIENIMNNTTTNGNNNTTVPINVEQHRTVGIPPYVKAQDDNAEIFQIAIVDFLARFNNMVKKTAHAMKSLRWSDDELSTVNSKFYGDRLNQYVKVVFPPNNSILIRTKEELYEYFKEQAATKLNLLPSAPAPNISAINNGNFSSKTTTLVKSPSQQKQQENAYSTNPEVIKLADLAIQQLPDNAIKALAPDCRSPGTLIVDSNGKHIVIIPTGVSTAPRSLVERSKLHLLELSTKEPGQHIFANDPHGGSVIRRASVVNNGNSPASPNTPRRSGAVAFDA